MSIDPESTSTKRSWFRFSLRTLLLVVLLVAVYLGGRYGIPSPFPVDLAGKWQANLPAGFKRPVTLTHLEDNRFVLGSAADVFNGVYEWKDGQLIVVDPSDDRMDGLTWKWDRETQSLLLIAEPEGTPTGSSYLGTKLLRMPPGP